MFTTQNLKQHPHIGINTFPFFIPKRKDKIQEVLLKEFLYSSQSLPLGTGGMWVSSDPCDQRHRDLAQKMCFLWVQVLRRGLNMLRYPYIV